MILDELVTLKVAKLLKDKGFNEPTQAFYFTVGGKDDLHYAPHKMIDDKCYVYEITDEYKGNPCIDNAPITDLDEGDNKFYIAPTQAVVMRWLREVHDIQCEMSPAQLRTTKGRAYHYRVFSLREGFVGTGDSYEEALEGVLDCALTHLIK